MLDSPIAGVALLAHFTGTMCLLKADAINQSSKSMSVLRYICLLVHATKITVDI